jgi:hypothetical protein
MAKRDEATCRSARGVLKASDPWEPRGGRSRTGPARARPAEQVRGAQVHGGQVVGRAPMCGERGLEWGPAHKRWGVASVSQDWGHSGGFARGPRRHVCRRDTTAWPREALDEVAGPAGKADPWRPRAARRCSGGRWCKQNLGEEKPRGRSGAGHLPLSASKPPPQESGRQQIGAPRRSVPQGESIEPKRLVHRVRKRQQRLRCCRHERAGPSACSAERGAVRGASTRAVAMLRLGCLPAQNRAGAASRECEMPGDH